MLVTRSLFWPRTCQKSQIKKNSTKDHSQNPLYIKQSFIFFNKTHSQPNLKSQIPPPFQVLLLPHPEKWQPGDRDWQLPLLHRLLPLVPHLKQLRGSHLRESHLHQPRHIRLCDLPRPTGGEPPLDRGRSATSAKPHLSLDLCKRCLLRHLHGKPPQSKHRIKSHRSLDLCQYAWSALCSCSNLGRNSIKLRANVSWKIVVPPFPLELELLRREKQIYLPLNYSCANFMYPFRSGLWSQYSGARQSWG